MTRQRILLGVAVVLAAVAVVLGARALGGTDVRAAVDAAGAWAPVLFLLVHGTVCVTPVPRTVFTVAAGVLFGPVAGVLLAVGGSLLAAAASFWLVRWVGRRLVERHAHRAGIAWVRARLERRGLLAVVSLRLIAPVPFPVLNYAAGLSGVAFVPYLVGTLLGVLPGTVPTVVLGDAAIGGDPHPALILVSVACGIVGLVGLVLAARRPDAPALWRRG